MAIMKTRALITGVAALFLATGQANANDNWLDRCGKWLIHTWGHHWYEFYLVPNETTNIDKILDGPRLPKRLFRIDDDANLYLRGRKCLRIDKQ
jgi:hypothetical protein